MSRPKNARNRKTIVRELALRKHPVPVGDEVQLMNLVQYVVFCLKLKMMKADIPAENALKDFFAQIGASEHQGVLLAPTLLSNEDWAAREAARNANAMPPARDDDEDRS
jgi:hypothetical protein